MYRSGHKVSSVPHIQSLSSDTRGEVLLSCVSVGLMTLVLFREHVAYYLRQSQSSKWLAFLSISIPLQITMKISPYLTDKDYDALPLRETRLSSKPLWGGVEVQLANLARATAIMQAKKLETEALSAQLLAKKRANRIRHEGDAIVQMPEYQEHVVERLERELNSLLRRAINGLLEGRRLPNRAMSINNTTASILDSLQEIMDAVILRCTKRLKLERTAIAHVLKATLAKHLEDTTLKVRALIRPGVNTVSIKDLDLLPPEQVLDVTKLIAGMD